MYLDNVVLLMLIIAISVALSPPSDFMCSLVVHELIYLRTGVDECLLELDWMVSDCIANCLLFGLCLIE